MRHNLGAHAGAGFPKIKDGAGGIVTQRVSQAELQNELVTQNIRAIKELAAPGPASDNQRQQAEAHVRQISGLLAAGPVEPAQARQWVKLLRNGDWAALPAAPARPAVVAITPAPTEPPPAPSPAPPVVDPAERARLRGEITALRSELCRIQAQLRRFNATIQMDQGQRDEWEKRVNDAYENSLDRVKEALAEFTVSFPEEKLTERLESLTDPVERAKLKRGLRLVQRLKEAYTLKDFSAWAAHEDYGRDEMLEGVGIIAEVLEVEEKVKDYLGKRWGLKRFFAYQEAASELITSTFDVTSEVVAWRRLNQLNRNSEDFLVATQKSGERIRKVIAGIHEREVRLGLDPGATKELCP